MCLGLFLMPFLPILVVEVLVFGKGLDMFHRFDVAPGTVTAVFQEPFEVLASRPGQFGALYTQRVRPVVVYEFVYQDRPYTSARYYLVEHDLYSDLASNPATRGSVGASLLEHVAPGSQVQVKVARGNPSLSYVEWGWPALLRICAYWIRSYLLLVVFGALLYPLIAISRAARQRSQRG
jgi:hypothetical protein